MTIDLRTLRGFVECKEHLKGSPVVARAITKELWILNELLPDKNSERKWRLSAAYLRELLVPEPTEEDVCTQRTLKNRSDNLALRGAPLSSHPLICLVNLADAENVQNVHNVLCMLLAQELDISSAWTLKESFSGDECVDMSARSLLQIMSHVKDLDRLTKVCSPLNQLLETADAGMVFRHRMSPLTPCFEALMSSQDANLNFNWRDAFYLFQSLLSQDTSFSASSMLPQLAVSTLTQVSSMNPQHLGHITFLSCILHAIQRASYMHKGHAAGTCALPTLGPEAAEVFLGAVQHLSKELHTRLAATASRIQMCGALNAHQKEHVATEYFTVFAQSRELLSRAQELVTLNFSDSLAHMLTGRICAFMDGLMLNYGVSDAVTELATCLPTGIALKQPSIGRLLSGIFFRNLPVPERQRLGLTMPTTASLEDWSFSDVHVSFRCASNKTTAELPWCILKPMTKLAAAVRLFLKWRSLNKPTQGCARLSGHALHEDECMANVPLNVSFTAFSEVLDFAKISSLKTIIGDPVAQQQQFKKLWFSQVASKSAALQRDILKCALVVGCDEIVREMQYVQ